jgi:uncharacterized protein
MSANATTPTAAGPTRAVPPQTSTNRDACVPLPPGAVQPGGLLGQRFHASEANRLLLVDEDELLGGFRNRPGKQAWIGEHVGKWLHAATLSYACSGNQALREKLDRVVTALLGTQEADGYLGTYSPEHRFSLDKGSEWDVWVHKYNLIGLLTYHEVTGSAAALGACRRIADLLAETFGPGKKSIASTSLWAGMASTSVLDPVVLLYSITGERRYLEFAEYIVAAWDDPGGARILSGLLAGAPVYTYGEGKAYEFMSNVIGLVRLYRATGAETYLTAACNAWKDIAANRLYITGSGSTWERWRPDHCFPNTNGGNGLDTNLCETCVTVTWMQLNLELYRTLGGAEFAEQIERTVYNHLLGAQGPGADRWCCYPPLEGTKVFRRDTNCCLSSGPRAIALLPTVLYSTTLEGLDVPVFAASKARVHLADGGVVDVEQETEYPLDGRVRLRMAAIAPPRPFTLRLRVPAWTPGVTLRVNGQPCMGAEPTSGFVSIRREWRAGDTVTYDIDMAPRAVLGDHGNAGKVAVLYGPLVLAADGKYNPAVRALAETAVAAADPAALELRLADCGGLEGVPRFEVAGLAPAPGATAPQRLTLSLVPYYIAGAEGSPFVVWMNHATAPPVAGRCSCPLPKALGLRAHDERTQDRLAPADPRRGACS